MIAKSGVYVIKNCRTGRRYIGSTIDFAKRVRAHKNDLKANKHRNKALQADFNAGEEFSYHLELIVPAATKEQLLKFEQVLLNLETDPYNAAKLVTGTRLGMKHTDAAKVKMSLARKGKPSPRAGIKLSEETKQRMRNAHAGKPKPWKKNASRNEKGRFCG